jgi:hypothetical protein
LKRTCKGTNERGEACAQAPGSDRDYCFWHDPELEKEREEARRAGGIARRRELVLREVYGIEGADGLADAGRMIDLATVVLLGLDNSVPKARGLLNAAQTLMKMVEVGKLAEDVAAMKSVVLPRLERLENERKPKRRYGR